MEFDLDDAVSILRRTPAVLRALLGSLPERWTHRNEGGDSWSPYDVLGHLIHGETTDWIARAKRILADGESRAFEPFDRFAQERESVGKSLDDLLDEFESRRAESLRALAELDLGPEDLDRRGTHPELGTVTLRQLLATWTVHDFSHLRQISRVMAKRYRDQVGPWAQYLPVFDE